MGICGRPAHQQRFSPASVPQTKWAPHCGQVRAPACRPAGADFSGVISFMVRFSCVGMKSRGKVESSEVAMMIPPTINGWVLKSAPPPTSNLCYKGTDHDFPSLSLSVHVNAPSSSRTCPKNSDAFWHRFQSSINSTGCSAAHSSTSAKARFGKLPRITSSV